MTEPQNHRTMQSSDEQHFECVCNNKKKKFQYNLVSVCTNVILNGFPTLNTSKLTSLKQIGLL